MFTHCYTKITGWGLRHGHFAGSLGLIIEKTNLLDKFGEVAVIFIEETSDRIPLLFGFFVKHRRDVSVVRIKQTNYNLVSNWCMNATTVQQAVFWFWGSRGVKCCQSACRSNWCQKSKKETQTMRQLRSLWWVLPSFHLQSTWTDLSAPMKFRVR